MEGPSFDSITSTPFFMIGCDNPLDICGINPFEKSILKSGSDSASTDCKKENERITSVVTGNKRYNDIIKFFKILSGNY